MQPQLVPLSPTRRVDQDSGIPLVVALTTQGTKVIAGVPRTVGFGIPKQTLDKEVDTRRLLVEFTVVVFTEGECTTSTTIKIADAELEIMRVLWSEGHAMTSTKIRDKLRDASAWSKSTVLTLIGRLVKKGAVSCTKEAHLLYAPLVSEKDYRNGRTRKLIDTLYDGSVRNLVVALCTPGNLTKKEREELQQYLEGGLEQHE